MSRLVPKIPPTPPGITLSSVTTTDATPKVLATLATSSSTAVQRYTGQVSARNTTTQESAVWDVAWATKKAGGICALFGAVSVGLFQGDGNLANDAGTLAVPSVAASGNGCQLSVTGLAATPLTWTCKLSDPVET